MRLLAIDTSLQRCSVGLAEGTEILGTRHLEMERGHAEVLAPLVLEMMSEAGWAFDRLDRVAIVTGPGGFTGLRVGLAFARGLVIGHTMEIVGISSLEALAQTAITHHPKVTDIENRSIATIVDARRSEFFLASYKRSDNGSLSTVLPPCAQSPEIAAQHLEKLQPPVGILAGSGVKLLKAQQLETYGIPYTDDLIEQIDIEAVIALGNRADPSPYPPAPVYLRAPDAKPAATSHFDFIKQQS